MTSSCPGTPFLLAAVAAASPTSFVPPSVTPITTPWQAFAALQVPFLQTVLATVWAEVNGLRPERVTLAVPSLAKPLATMSVGQASSFAPSNLVSQLSKVKTTGDTVVMGIVGADIVGVPAYAVTADLDDVPRKVVRYFANAARGT